MVSKAQQSSRRRPSGLKPGVVARPRKLPEGKKVTLSFFASVDMVREFDDAAERVYANRPVGESKPSRSDLIRMILTDWIADPKRPESHK